MTHTGGGIEPLGLDATWKVIGTVSAGAIGREIMAAERRGRIKALEEAADMFLSDAANARGGPAAWLTTGDKVAAVVADWLREDAAALRAAERAEGAGA